MLVGYMRVSSDTDRQTTDLQRDAWLEAGVDPRQLCADKASGARDDRLGLQQALASVHPGDCLVIWKLDRLGRSLPHLLQIVTTLQAQGVAFRSLTEQMDTTTPQGAFLLSVFGALAPYERALTQERIKAGFAAAKRRGKRGGRPQAMSDEKLAATLTALQGGASTAAMCRTFGVKRTALYDALGRATPQLGPHRAGGASPRRTLQVSPTARPSPAAVVRPRAPQRPAAPPSSSSVRGLFSMKGSQ